MAASVQEIAVLDREGATENDCKLLISNNNQVPAVLEQ